MFKHVCKIFETKASIYFNKLDSSILETLQQPLGAGPDAPASDHKSTVQSQAAHVSEYNSVKPNFRAHQGAQWYEAPKM